MSSLLSGSAGLIKYLLFIFNFLFVLSGIIILSVGATVQGVYHGYAHFLDDHFFSVPKFLIIIGTIIFFIAFFGCCGAYKENYCMVLSFSVMLALVFVLELSAGISGYVLRNDTKQILTDSLNKTMPEYLNQTAHKDTVVMWDTIQERFECCGLDSAQNWLDTIHGIPMSCCERRVGAINETLCQLESEELHKTGCITAFGGFIKEHAVSLGGVGIGLAVVQFVGIFFACYIAKQIRDKQWLQG